MARLGEWTREIRPDWVEVRRQRLLLSSETELSRRHYSPLQDKNITAYEYVGASVLLEPKW